MEKHVLLNFPSLIPFLFFFRSVTFWNSTTLTDLGSVGLAMIDASVLRKMEQHELRVGLRRIFVEDEYFSGENYIVSSVAPKLCTG